MCVVSKTMFATLMLLLLLATHLGLCVFHACSQRGRLQDEDWMDLGVLTPAAVARSVVYTPVMPPFHRSYPRLGHPPTPSQPQPTQPTQPTQLQPHKPWGCGGSQRRRNRLGKRVNAASGREECCICFSETPAHRFCTLPCHHAFCWTCVQWLDRCALCRAEIV